MSRFYCFASDTELPEQANPKVKQLSINEAIKLNIDVDLSLFDDNFDRDLPKVILFVKDDSAFDYPNIYSINKEEINDEIITTKQFYAGLDWHYSESSVDVLIKYIKSHLKTISEIELWSVRLGHDGLSLEPKKEQCNLNKLTKNRLEDFFESYLDSYCLTILR